MIEVKSQSTHDHLWYQLEPIQYVNHASRDLSPYIQDARIFFASKALYAWLGK